MTLNSSSKLNRLTLALSAAVISVACSTGLAQTPPTTTAPAATAPASQPATQPFSFGPITAVINGENLTRDEFQITLEQIAGAKVFEQILSVVVAQKACENAGIVVKQEQFQAQLNRFKDNLREQGVEEDQLDRALAMTIQRQGLTPLEFDMAIRRKAYMTALAKDHGEVSAEQLETAYKQDTGRKFQVLDITVDFAQAPQLRNMVEKDKVSIVDATRKLGLQTRPVLISEFSTEAETPKSVLDSAKNLKENSLSVVIPLEAGNHMLYMEKIIPAQDIKPEEVAAYKEKLRLKLFQANQDNWANQQLQYLMQRATIEFKDPVLGRIYQQIAAARKAQADAATQPATMPASASAPAK